MTIRLLIIIQLFFIYSCKNEGKNQVAKTKKNKVTVDSTTLTSNQLHKKHLNNFESNPNYFIRDIDFNKDGIADKIVSNEKYQGDELYLFVNKNNQYNLILETINLSEDGGKIIGDIIATSKGDEVFKIHTYFPDRGNLQATHFISYTNNKWLLKRTIYETSSLTESEDTYICDVAQNIPLEELNTANGFEEFKQMPNEVDRDKLCIKQNLIFAKIDSISLSQIKKNKRTNQSIFDYYKTETIDGVDIWSNKMFGRCCSNTDISYSETLSFSITANVNNKSLSSD